MSCALKSTISPLSSFLSSPKSNSSFQFLASSPSYLRMISAVKGQPALERKPSSGPMCLLASSCSASATSKVRPAGDLPNEKPQASSPVPLLPVQP
ncbi:hypothetical protein D9M69_504490 [compost metagenome]